MPVHGTVSAVIQTLEGAQDVAKAIRQSGYLLDKSDLKRLLADLSASISETKMELTLLQSVVEEKDAELIRMHEAQVYRVVILGVEGMRIIKRLIHALTVSPIVRTAGKKITSFIIFIIGFLVVTLGCVRTVKMSTKPFELRS